MGHDKLISVEVAYATPTTQRIMVVQVREGITIEEVIRMSGILDVYPEIDLHKNKVGVFSKSKELMAEVKAGDRVEIYRPLTMDPKEARKKRVRKKVKVKIKNKKKNLLSRGR